METKLERIHFYAANKTWILIIDNPILFNQIEIEISEKDAKNMIEKLNLTEKYLNTWTF